MDAILTDIHRMIYSIIDPEQPMTEHQDFPSDAGCTLACSNSARHIIPLPERERGLVFGATSRYSNEIYEFCVRLTHSGYPGANLAFSKAAIDLDTGNGVPVLPIAQVQEYCRASPSARSRFFVRVAP